MFKIAPNVNRTIAEALRASARTSRSNADTHEALADAIEGMSVGTAPKYFDQYSSPLSKNVFLRLVRSGELPAHRVGKRVLVEVAVFDTWLASKRHFLRETKQPNAATPDTDLLAELGLTAKGGAR
jgi:excisionase family DNA binding protein